MMAHSYSPTNRLLRLIIHTEHATRFSSIWGRVAIKAFLTLEKDMRCLIGALIQKRKPARGVFNSTPVTTHE